MGTVTFFQKNKIKKRVFKKKHHLINQTPIFKIGFNSHQVLKNLLYYYSDIKFNKYNINNVLYSNIIINKEDNKLTSIVLTQKFNNPKVVIFKDKKNLNTFSVGSIIKYFKVKQSKCLRRGLRGLNIFLNFLKNIVDRKYITGKTKCNYLILSIVGFDYNLLQGRRSIKYFFKKNICGNIFFLYNLKVSFTKTKNKKIKSIKKRLKKKIILNFLKKTNI